ncbi:MAG: hypothetical protein ABJZ55_25385 [Fuerstiella sp.]
MATPFTFFRKYAGGLMVVMVILSMMLFTMDGIFSDTSANLWLLGMLIGSAAFGIAGIGSGRWIQWGIGGAILGTALGLILPGFAAGGGLSSTVGTFDQARMEDLGTRRSIANQFMAQVNPMARFQGPSFGFGQQNMSLDLIFGALMRAEADELGIAIDSDGVSQYLKEVGRGELTEEKYLTLRNSMSYQGKALDEETFQEILSDEIRGRLAFMMLQTRTTSTPPAPDVYWQYFRRLKVRQQVEVATLNVDQFLSEIAEPTDSEIENLFEEFKEYFPNSKEPGSPGFALRTRANLAYLELDAKSVENSLDAITDEEVKAYYEENKEGPLIRSIVIPEDDTDGDSEEGTDGEAAAEEKTDDAKTDDAKSDDTKSDDAKTDDKAETTDEDASEQSDSDAKEAEPKKPAAQDMKKEEAAAAEKADANDTKETVEESTATEKKDSEKKPAEEKAEEAKKAVEEKATEAKEEVKQQTAKKPVFNQDQTEEGQKTDTTKKTETAEQPKEVEAGDAPKASEEKQADTKTDAGDQATPEKTDSQEKPAQNDTLAIPDMSSLPDVPSFDTGDMPEPEYEYRELDEELSKLIRELIMADRVSDEMASRMKSAQGEMELLARRYGEKRMQMIEADPSTYDASAADYQESLKSLRESMGDFYAELNADLKKLGSKYGFAFVETGLIGGQELRSSEDFTIGAATEPSANPMMQFQATPIVNSIYSGLSFDEQNNAGLMFQVSKAVRPGSAADEPERRFLYWLTDISPQHVPELDEAGVRDTVVTALKSEKARELVKTRGEALAKIVKAGLNKEGDEKQKLVDSLKDQTVTGSKGGVPLARRVSMPFSWMRVTQAPQMSFQGPQAERSIITFEQDGGAPLDMIGDRFMSVIFEDMKDEDVQVVPNFDYSAYHVVHVTNRFPTPEIGEDGLREEFAKEAQQTGFRNSPLLPVMSTDLNRPPAIKWQDSIWKKYQIDLNADSE